MFQGISKLTILAYLRLFLLFALMTLKYKNTETH